MPGTSKSQERSGWRAALQKGIWGCCMTSGSTGTSSVPRQPRGKLHPGVHQTQRNQTVKRSDYPVAFSTGVASP